MTPGQTILFRRLATDVSQVDLATAVGVTKSYLCHVEAGRRTPRQDLVNRVHEHLDGIDTRTVTITVEADGVRRTLHVQAVSPQAAFLAASVVPEDDWETRKVGERAA